MTLKTHGSLISKIARKIPQINRQQVSALDIYSRSYGQMNLQTSALWIAVSHSKWMVLKHIFSEKIVLNPTKAFLVSQTRY
jgi:hypothetical protein